MIESFLKDISPPTIAVDEQPLSTGSGRNSERLFLEAQSIVQLIVKRRRISFQYSDIADLAQGIALRLWKWRSNNVEKGDLMTEDEWNSYAARTAYNEVNRHLSKSAQAGISLDLVEQIAESSIEGETPAEVFSLIRSVWQEISELSLRQRRALLLHSQELVIYFLQSGIKNADLARILEFSVSEWNEICGRMPLSDMQIAALRKGCNGRNEDRSRAAIAGAIKKARFDARKKLEGIGNK